MTPIFQGIFRKTSGFLLFFVFLLLSIFVLPRNVSAVSGCCSYHSGVCCSCGAQYNGKVICNDGWRGSSCYYSEMVMCAGYNPSYPTPTPSCPLFSSYNSLSGSCECYSGYISSGGRCISTSSYCHNLYGYSSRYNTLTDRCECSYGYVVDSSGKCSSGNSVCWNKYGYHSRYDSLDKTCECSYGYVFNLAGTKCISEDDACEEQFGYGAKATISGDKCECKYGYVWSGGQCVWDTSSYEYPDTGGATNYQYFSPTPQPTVFPTPKPTQKPTDKPTEKPTISPTPAIEGVKTEDPTPTPQPTEVSDGLVNGILLAPVLFILWIFYKYRWVIKERFSRRK